MIIFSDQADHSHLCFFFSLPSLSLRISWPKNLTWFYVFVCFLKQYCAWCQRQQRGVQKSVMHLQSCCFVYINLLLFAVLVAVAVVFCLSSLKKGGGGASSLGSL